MPQASREGVLPMMDIWNCARGVFARAPGGVEKLAFRAVAYTSAIGSFGSRQRLKAAAVIRNCHPTFHKPRSLVLRIPPVCFIHPKAFSISGRFFWLRW